MNAPTALLALALLVATGCGRYGPPLRSPQGAAPLPEAPAEQQPAPEEEPQADDERERPR